MKRYLHILGAGLVALSVMAGTARAATVASIDSGKSIHFDSEANAKDPNLGMSSFVLSSGTTTMFDYPTPAGSDEITVASTKTRSFNATIFGWTFTWSHSILGSHAWTWNHYTEWAGNGQCITNKLLNNQYTGQTGPLWRYQGAGGYFIWTINPPCQPLGIIWSGNQGKYSYCALTCVQDDYPWELGEGYATGNYRTYDHGCTGACG